MPTRPCHSPAVRFWATLLWLAYVVASYAYGHSGEGEKGPLLSCGSGGKDCYDTSIELQSSGGDDDILISMGLVIGIVPLLLSLWRWRRPIYRAEFVGWAGLLMFQMFWVMLIEVGSIYDTIRYGGNVPLLVWTLSLFGLAVIAMTGLARCAWSSRA